MTRAVLTLDRAVFGYHGTAITQPLDLGILEGQVVAVLGANGSGKSTLVKGVLGLSELLSGSVSIFGAPRARFSEHQRVGYVPQRHTLSGSVRATTREVVGTGLLAARPWWRGVSRRDRDRIDGALDAVDLLDRAGADVATLSGGQHRRVLIARALAGGPDVLLLDEPTAGVDASHQAALATVLRRLAGTGVTMVLVTHELAAMRGVVDRIIEMDAGRVAFDGTPAGYREVAAARAAAAGAASEGHDGHHADHEPEQHHPSGLLGPGPLDRASAPDSIRGEQ